MVSPARTARAVGGRTRYVPPTATYTVESASLGFTNGLLLRTPRLYLAGDQRLLEFPGVAIVGARKASPDGKRRAYQISRELVRAGLVVISGLAAGIDESAHRAALDFGGRTIAVVAMPLDRVYPAEHAELQQAIYERHLLVSVAPIGKRVFPKDFPERNRAMARIARATVIIEAGDTSGTLHQVVESVDAGRPVFIARSTVEDPSLTWPARFVGKTPLVHVLDTPGQVIEMVTGIAPL